MSWQAVETVPLTIGAAVCPQRAAAILTALLRRAVPLARLVNGRLEPLATALLVKADGQYALLTAAHVFEQARVGDIAVPLPREGRVIALGHVRSRLALHPQRDIALVTIDDCAAARALAANWQACPLNHWLGGSTVSSQLFVVAGYPGVNARRIDGCMYSKPVIIFTGALDSERYAYARTALRVDGIEIHTPELDGVSGATLWAVNDSEPGEDCVLSPAAVQVAFLHSRYLRAEPIVDVGTLLSRRF